MKKAILSPLEVLKRKYSRSLLSEIAYCRDEIRGLVGQDRASGYSDDEIEAKMGDYLDEVYSDYFHVAANEYGVTEEEFDYIYQILEDIDGPVVL